MLKKIKFESITQFSVLENKIKSLEDRIIELEKRLNDKICCSSLPSETELSDLKDFHQACLIKNYSNKSWNIE